MQDRWRKFLAVLAGPDQPHANATATPSFFKGSISDVALFDQFLPTGTVGQMYAAGHTSSQVLNKVTVPDGKMSTRKSLLVENGRSAIVEA